MRSTRRLDAGEVVLLSSLGFSPTGEIFNLTLEDVASQTAIALNADKLVFLMDEPGVPAGKGDLLRELTVSDAERLMKKGKRKLGGDAGLYLPFAARACRAGVKRAHLISRHEDGALLLELFTHNGVGTMVTQDPLEQVRQATIDDVGGILHLIEPLEADGTLVKRSRELLEIEIDRFTVIEHDGLIVGCAALYPFKAEAAGGVRLPGGASRVSRRRRRRAPAAGDRSQGDEGALQAAVRAHHARVPLVHRAGLRGNRRGEAAPHPRSSCTTSSAVRRCW